MEPTGDEKQPQERNVEQSGDLSISKPANPFQPGGSSTQQPCNLADHMLSHTLEEECPLSELHARIDHEIQALDELKQKVNYHAAVAIGKGKIDGLDIAAFLLVLQRIVEAVQKRWEQRSVDQMGRSLANAPQATPPTTDEA